MRRIATVAILTLCVALGTTLWAHGADGKVVVVVDENYPPYMYGTGEQAKGLYPALIDAIFARMGSEVEIRAIHWEEALKAGEEGKAAVGGIYKNDTRLKIYDYSEPLFEERLAVYVKKGKAFPFNKLSDLQGKVIGLIHEWSYGEEFDEARKEDHFTVEEVETDMQNFEKLASGKLDCIIADRVAAAQIMHRENWSSQFEQLDRLAAANQAYVAFAKRLGKQDLLNRFNQILAEMKKDGSYERIVDDFIKKAPR